MMFVVRFGIWIVVQYLLCNLLIYVTAVVIIISVLRR